MESLREFLTRKGAEYAPFEPSRAVRLHEILAPHLQNRAGRVLQSGRESSSKNSDSKNLDSKKLVSKNLDSKKVRQKIIHIVGTNGKGSTGRFLALMLESVGRSFLHFTSPHLFRFNERFYKNGAIASDAELEVAHEFLGKIPNLREESSYFEYATWLALVLGAECEFIILEAGLGGEFDSTNACAIDLSIFSKIAIDHKEFLGESLEEIAATKLRAMRSRAILSCDNEPCVVEIAKKIASQKNADLEILDSKKIPESVARYIAKFGLAEFLSANLFSAIKAAELLGIATNLEQLPPLNLPGRCQKIAPNILLDVGHNISCAAALKSEILRLGWGKAVLIYNTYKEKDVSEILTTLKDIIEQVLILSDSDLLKNVRIIEQNKLKSILDSLGLPHKSLKSADIKFSPTKNYAIFGSFSVASTMMEIFKT